jgi:hypothetical protein
LKNDVNVPVWDPYVSYLPDPHADQLVRSTDPRIRIRIKISRFRNTGFQDVRTLIDKKYERTTLLYTKNKYMRENHLPSAMFWTLQFK